jgi:hypothetical protein
MANKEHLLQLKKGVDSWNAWRSAKDGLRDADLSGTSLFGANLNLANLSAADLRGANLGAAGLYRADLSNANLFDAHLNSANLSGADLDRANLSDADLLGANLSDANLNYADLRGARLLRAQLRTASFRSTCLDGADLSQANFNETVFTDVDLTKVIGLETCKHHGPSTFDVRTLTRSSALPLTFLRGVGLPERLIEFLPSLFNQPIQYYSCFISYSTKDQEFADRIYADLQDKGVRCWFAPHDLPIGGKILDEIDAAVRVRDKLLLILSEYSIESNWVEDEVTSASKRSASAGKSCCFQFVSTTRSWRPKKPGRPNFARAISATFGAGGITTSTSEPLRASCGT